MEGSSDSTWFFCCARNSASEVVTGWPPRKALKSTNKRCDQTANFALKSEFSRAAKKEEQQVVILRTILSLEIKIQCQCLRQSTARLYRPVPGRVTVPVSHRQQNGDSTPVSDVAEAANRPQHMLNGSQKAGKAAVALYL